MPAHNRNSEQQPSELFSDSNGPPCGHLALQDALSMIAEPVTVISTAGEMLFCNSAFRSVFFAEPDTVTGGTIVQLSVLNFLNNEGISTLKSIFANSAFETCFQFVASLKLANGNTKRVRLRGTPAPVVSNHDGNAKTKAWICTTAVVEDYVEPGTDKQTFGDATRRKNVPSDGIDEVACSQEECGTVKQPCRLAEDGSFRELAGVIPHLVWLANSNGEILYYSSQVTKFQGIKQNEDGTWHWAPVVHPDERQKTVDAWQHSMRTGETYQCEHRVKMRNGEYHWHLSRAQLGQDGMWYGTATDIHELKGVETQLQDLTGRFQTALEASQIVVFNQDCNLRYTWIHNPTPGYTVASVLGKTDSDLLDEREEAEQLEQIKRGVITSGVPARMEVSLTHTDQRRWFDLMVQPQHDMERNIAGVTCVAVDITRRKQIERELEISESRFRQIYENAATGIAIVDFDGTYVHCNKAYLNIVGYSEQELTHIKVFELFHPDDRQENLEQIQTLISGEKSSYEMENRIIHHDGRTLWVHKFVSVYRDDKGEPCHMVALITDVTERRRAERNRETLAELAEAFAPISTADQIVNRSSDILQRRLGVVKIGCYDILAQPASSNTFVARMHPACGDSQADVNLGNFLTADALNRLKAGEVIVVDDIHTSHETASLAEAYKDENIKSMILVPAISSEGWTFMLCAGDVQPRRWLADETELLQEVATRINLSLERSRTEESLRASEDRFRKTFEHAAMGVAHIGLDGQWLRANDRYCEILGYRQEELLAKRFADVTHPDDIDGDWAQAIRLKSGEINRYSLEKRYIRKDGSTVPVILTASLIRKQNGDPDYFVAVAEDITLRKQAEDSLREQDRRKEEFLATLAHELRNPLAPIRTGLEIMKLADNNPKLMEETRLTMERQTLQLISIVDDLLDVSRISHGKLTLRESRIQLSGIVRDTVESCRPMVDAAGHTLKITLPSEPVWLFGDSNRLTQILANLVSNAVKYTPRNGEISLEAQVIERDVEITVSDNGIGIPKDMLGRIFEMFTQIQHPGDEGYTGLGIGLTLVKNLVELHRGTIEVDSDGVGRGSKFTVRLPIPQSTAAEPEVPKSQAAGALPKKEREKIPSAAKRRVLVVDDNQSAAKMLGMVIRMDGNEVRLAGDGFEAIEVAEQFAPHVIFMDIGMPKLDGYGAAERIRRESWGKEIVLIALTGWGQDSDREKTHAAGFDHHLVKPAEPTEIARLLATVIV